jgi:hypothetical protein
MPLMQLVMIKMMQYIRYLEYRADEMDWWLIWDWQHWVKGCAGNIIEPLQLCENIALQVRPIPTAHFQTTQAKFS